MADLKLYNVAGESVSYSGITQVVIPNATSGSTTFTDTSDANAVAGNMLSGKTAYVNGVKITGNIATKTSSNLSASGATVTVPAGYYASQATKTVTAGSASTPATTITTTPTMSINTATGVVSASNSKSQSVTPTVSTGYVSAGTAGTITVNGSNTLNLTTQAAQTITPGTANQTIAAGKYLTGAQIIKGDSDLVAANIKTGIEIFSVTGTYTSDANATASDIVLNKTAYVNGTKLTGTLADYDGSTSPLNSYVVYTVCIDQSNSNPLTCITYQDDAVGMVKGSDDWDECPIFCDIKPCVFSEGEVVYYLNRDDYTEKLDGTPSNLDGTDGDVMVEFPKFGYKIYKDSGNLYVSITDNPNASADGFCYEAFSRYDEGDLDYFYEGAYKGYIENWEGTSWSGEDEWDENSMSSMRSISGVEPAVNINMYTVRSAAMANGTNYHQSLYSHIVAIQCLYLIKYGNLNSQKALGQGLTNGAYPAETGATDSSGFCYGDTTDGAVQMKLFGIEDFWGNIFEWVDGIYTDSSCNYVTFWVPDANGDPVETTTTFTDVTTRDDGGYTSDVAGTNAAGFAPIAYSGSTSTFWSSYGGASAGYFARFGGYGDDGDGAGAFGLDVGGDPDYAIDYLGGRICYH